MPPVARMTALARKILEAAAFAIVTKRSADAPAILQQREDADFHVDIDALMHAVILQGADHFQPGAIADVREARIFMAAEISLQNAAIFRAIENRAPGFELAHPLRRFLGVQLRHPPIVDVLPAAHRVGEMDLPVVAVVHVGERGRDAALGHHGVRFAEQGICKPSRPKRRPPRLRSPRAARRRPRR